MSIGAGIFEKLKDQWGQETTNSVSFISTGNAVHEVLFDQSILIYRMLISFSHSSVTYLTYSTPIRFIPGPSTWVDIYTQRSQEGNHYEITPLRDVDLSLVGALDNPDQTTWNDNVMSGFIRSSGNIYVIM